MSDSPEARFSFYLFFFGGAGWWGLWGSEDREIGSIEKDNN